MHRIQSGKAECRDRDLVRAPFEARFEVIRSEHNGQEVEREMACQDCGQNLGAIENSASEARRWKIDLMIIEVRCPSAQGFFHRFEWSSQRY